MKKGMATVWVVIITAIIALGVGGGGGYYYLNSQTENETDDDSIVISEDGSVVEDDGEEDTAPLVDTSDWKTMKFDAGGSIKYPNDWQITDPDYAIKGIEIYMIDEDDKGGSGGIYLYDLEEWLQGPGPDDAYVMSKDEREDAYQTLKNIYNQKKLSPETRIELNDYRLEFFTYNQYDRSDVKYIESVDRESRGFTMVNAYGQDVGLATDYIVSLFNEKKNTVLMITMPITSDYSEMVKLQEQYGDYSQDTDELIRIDRDVHQDFMQLMMSDREDLSFGKYLYQIDAVAKSVTN